MKPCSKACIAVNALSAVLYAFWMSNLVLQVCDFGLSRVRMSTVLSGKSQAGTPEWTAPEVLRSQAYDESSDCYS